MVLSGHQPNYLPYPGLIGKILQSDKFIYVSKVQFEKKSWQNRNRIKGNGQEIMLTVPVLTKGKFNQLIAEVRINNNENWRQKHFNSLRLSYKKSPYYSRYIDFFEDLYDKDWEYLKEIDIYVMNWILNELNNKTEIYYDENYDFMGKSTDYLVDMTEKLSCDTYLSNKGSEAYVDIDCFKNANLYHKYLNYVSPEYYQGKGEFIPNLSIVDMFFWLGGKTTEELVCDPLNYQYSNINERL